MEIGFSLGSNMGDRRGHLVEAKRRILAQEDTTLVEQSAIYETEPIDVAPKYEGLKFLNAVLVIESSKETESWLAVCHEIEHEMGRRRGEDRNAPRPVDIDILYAGNMLIDGPDLTVPHPHWAEREFVVRPLAEIRPHLVLPGSGQTVSQVLAVVEGTGGLKLSAEDW